MTTIPFLQTEEEFGNLSNLREADSYKAPDVLQSEKLNPPVSLPLSQYDWCDHDFVSDIDESQSPFANDKSPVHDPPEAIGRRPRRLLHVPSMTSLEWQPRDKYCENVGPTYDRVTCIGGRFSLRLGENKEDSLIYIGVKFYCFLL